MGIRTRPSPSVLFVSVWVGLNIEFFSPNVTILEFLMYLSPFGVDNLSQVQATSITQPLLPANIRSDFVVSNTPVCCSSLFSVLTWGRAGSSAGLS